ncbi:hypothetical protein [Nonomuraea rubra]|uniref:hypothetical protein n=1 Tax=Nonomuraea rubra TaxID=46180 RepID=UPI0036D2CF5D
MCQRPVAEPAGTPYTQWAAVTTSSLEAERTTEALQESPLPAALTKNRRPVIRLAGAPVYGRCTRAYPLLSPPGVMRLPEGTLSRRSAAPPLSSASSLASAPEPVAVSAPVVGTLVGRSAALALACLSAVQYRTARPGRISGDATAPTSGRAGRPARSGHRTASVRRARRAAGRPPRAARSCRRPAWSVWSAW